MIGLSSSEGDALLCDDAVYLTLFSVIFIFNFKNCNFHFAIATGNPEEMEMEQILSDLQALKKLYGLLHRGPADNTVRFFFHAWTAVSFVC